LDVLDGGEPRLLLGEPIAQVVLLPRGQRRELERKDHDAVAGETFSAHAEALPSDDDVVDDATACVTIHHWNPVAVGGGAAGGTR
jgi:hypothetical protein